MDETLILLPDCYSCTLGAQNTIEPAAPPTPDQPIGAGLHPIRSDTDYMNQLGKLASNALRNIYPH